MAGLIQVMGKKLFASTAYSVTGATAAFDMGICDSYHIVIVTASVSGTSPTADFQLQSSPDRGTTYVGLPLRSTQVTAAGNIHFVFRLGLGNSDAALESPSATTGGTLAKNCVFDPAYMKIGYVIGGSTPVITSTIWLLATVAGTQR